MPFNPAKRGQSMLSYRSFRLAERRDGWIGTGFRDLTGQAGASIGRQLEGTFTWTAIPERLTLETGFVHTWMGHLAEQVSGSAFSRGSRVFSMPASRRVSNRPSPQHIRARAHRSAPRPLGGGSATRGYCRIQRITMRVI